MMHLIRTVYKHFIKYDISLTLVNQVVLSVGAVLVVFVLSYFLSVETFGKTRFLASILAIVSFFSLPGIGTVFLQKMGIYSQVSFKRAILTQLRWGIGVTVASIFFGAVFYFRNDFDLAIAFLLVGVLSPIANLYLMPGLALAGLKRFKEKLIYDTLAITAIVIGATSGAFMTGTVAGTMVWYFGFQTVVTVILLWSVYQRLPIAEEDLVSTSGDDTYGKQLTLFQIPFTLLPALEKAFVFLLLGPEALALYVIVTLPLEHSRGTFRNFLQFSALPHFKKSSQDSGEIRHWLYVSGFVSVGIIAVVCVFAYAIVPVFFKDYVEVQSLIYLSSLAAVFLPAQVYVLILITKRAVKKLFFYAGATFVSDVLLLVLLASYFGLVGAIVAKILAGFVGAVLVVIIKRIRGENYE